MSKELINIFNEFKKQNDKESENEFEKKKKKQKYLVKNL